MFEVADEKAEGMEVIIVQAAYPMQIIGSWVSILTYIRSVCVEKKNKKALLASLPA